jgi:hypothetical protein
MANGRGMKTASRTLVKSQPELWELIDQPSRMEGLMSALLGRAAEVTVSEREPESVLSWQAADDGDDAWIKVQLAEKGWGTHVEVSAESPTEAIRLEGWLDAVLDELATPEKRPFSGMTETPPDVPSAAKPAPTEPAPVEEAKLEDPPVPDPPVEDAPVEETPVEAPATPEPPRKKRRRLFRFRF